MTKDIASGWEMVQEAVNYIAGNGLEQINCQAQMDGADHTTAHNVTHAFYASIGQRQRLCIMDKSLRTWSNACV